MTTAPVVTGSDGFLGWHVGVLARALGWPEPVAVGRDALADPDQLARKLNGANRVLHLAGANRGHPDEVSAGNLAPARALADALRRCAAPPRAVVFANSVQAGNGTPYGESKAAAAEVLREAATHAGSAFEDIRLPNVFGEHGRPFYNSVVATFCKILAAGGSPGIHEDRKLNLLHATDAAAVLLGVEAPATPGCGGVPLVHRCTVTDLAGRLTRFSESYRTGDIPVLSSHFDVRLFNTYRSHCFPGHYPIRLSTRSDARGGLTEAVKVHGGGGQVFFSSTRPGVTRGDHFHMAKVERFVVLRGAAEIALRRALHADVVRFRVSGTEPVVVDMPTMWIHNITNVGDTELLTLFWSNDLFDPARPDTYPEAVE
ncbi:MAG: capsular biosynthesis protein [Dactylosporangium sp.]|jgi:UDP-2-acetamido-2,6-beta-L-arabino-hexul-4-ose reductase|nr:capsular biosynthesis protein [Dactylosporangium sp.]